ncbi:hypothetical protein ACIOWE_17320 [Pseudomonas sp. NPDC087598]|uniref:hypothetical protein n=1 Tax=Pseudomonas sp. NPDC087598 TaxID=3364440 RepID=UPI0038149B70
MLTGDWISIFMALIATASAVVTFAVFRASTDPLVIVYAEPDLARPSIVNLIIKNIGKGPAHNISFTSDRPLPCEAFGIGEPSTVARAMSSGPIVTGIPFLAPEQKLSLTWGQYGGLHKYIGSEPIKISATFRRSYKSRMFSRKLSSTTCLDIQTFERSESSEHGFGPNIVKEMKVLNKTMKCLEDHLTSVNQTNHENT